MNNSTVHALLDECQRELASIDTHVGRLGMGNSMVPYLSKYGLMKACGVVEQAVKSVIADKCSFGTKPQVKNYLSAKVRNSSTNPSYGKICELLKDFDADWNTQFKAAVKNHPHCDQIKTSLQSLVDARNEFAHGGNPRVSIADVVRYFSDARQIVECVDTVIG
ncbi:MAG: hypothetical protein IPK64_00625 [bacterium]|nr:hypothetical protein [bacterium]